MNLGLIIGTIIADQRIYNWKRRDNELTVGRGVGAGGRSWASASTEAKMRKTVDKNGRKTGENEINNMEMDGK